MCDVNDTIGYRVEFATHRVTTVFANGITTRVQREFACRMQTISTKRARTRVIPGERFSVTTDDRWRAVMVHKKGTGIFTTTLNKSFEEFIAIDTFKNSMSIVKHSGRQGVPIAERMVAHETPLRLSPVRARHSKTVITRNERCWDIVNGHQIRRARSPPER